MKSLKCACGKVAAYNAHMKFNGYDIDGWECGSCGEAYYNPEKAERILLLNKVQKLKYQMKLSQVKSNLVLRVPKEVSEALGLKKGEHVELGIKNQNEIVIHALKAKGAA